jgi:hypothetical protein
LLVRGAPSYLLVEAQVDESPAPDRDWEELTPLHRTASSRADGIALRAGGDVPFALLPEFEWSPDALHLVYAEVSAPADTDMKVFFRVAGESQYLEKHSVRCSLKPGRNAVLVVLDQPGLEGPLRLAPGSHLGHYILHSIQVFRLRREPRPTQSTDTGTAHSIIAA